MFLGSIVQMHLIYDPAGLMRGLAGGALIGISSTLLWAATGQTLGVSGIVGGIVREGAAAPWRASFVAGMLAAGALVAAAVPAQLAFGAPVPLHWAASLLGGVLVGVGTRLGSGCTSGHGVCGLPRGSPRSMAAVACFMATGAIAAGISRAMPARAALYAGAGPSFSGAAFFAPIAVAIGAAVLIQMLARDKAAAPAPAAPSSSASTQALVFGCGLTFGLALVLSGMADPSKVLRFLDFAGADGFDPQLMLVMGGAVAVNLASVQWLARARAKESPPFMSEVAVGKPKTFGELLPLWTASPNTNIDMRLVLGSCLFGLGWGLCGVCPGPGLVAFASGGPQFAVAPAGVIFGMALYEATNSLAAAKCHSS